MTVFEDELSDLKVKILKMGSLVEEAIGRPCKSLVKRDSALAQKVIENDARINTYDVEIDEDMHPSHCLKTAYGWRFAVRNHGHENHHRPGKDWGLRRGYLRTGLGTQ